MATAKVLGFWVLGLTGAKVENKMQHGAYDGILRDSYET